MTTFKCNGGFDHKPIMLHIGRHYWIECPTCGREAYAVSTPEKAAQAWESDVGQKGRSNLIAHLKATP